MAPVPAIVTPIEAPGPRRHLVAYALAILAVALATAVDAVLFGHSGPETLIMVYLLGVLPVALRGQLGAAIAAALLAVVAFDFFFEEPYYQLAIVSPRQLFTESVMALVAGFIATLTSRLSAEVTASRARERRVSALYELSRTLLAAREPREALAAGTAVIAQELGLPMAAWLRGPDDIAVPVLPPVRPLTAEEDEVLRWVLQSGAAAGPGTTTLPGASHLFLPIRTDGPTLGALALAPPNGEIGPEMRGALEAGANQLAMALDQGRAREEAQAARRQAEVEQLRSALLGSVSHDLRTPLTGIVGAASSLADHADALHPTVQRELAQGIVVEAERLNRLVTNLLNATRLEAGTPSLAREWWALEDILAPVLARLERVLADRAVEVVLPPELPPLMADATLLEQVFANLLENAAKHTPPGTPISIRAWREGGALHVEVADVGPGLPPGEENRVFEAFGQVGPQGRAHGVGLGLAICRGVVTAHGGAISARNRPEGGAAFQVTLPLSPSPTPGGTGERQ